jgi:single-strand DNA-binding protein
MPNFNKVILAGNLTRDPELRYTPKGLAVAKLGLAINRTWKDESGQQKEEVTFVDVDAFGRQAEVISQYVKKGKPILVEGRLKLDQWDDKQTGQKRSRLGVTLESFQFLDSGGAREGGPGGGGAGSGFAPAPPDVSRQPAARPMGQRPQQSAPQPPPPSDEAMPPDAEDDVPF